MDSLAVAEYYSVDPDTVEYNWTNVDFLDRLEYMLVCNDIKRKQSEADARENRMKK